MGERDGTPRKEHSALDGLGGDFAGADGGDSRTSTGRLMVMGELRGQQMQTDGEGNVKARLDTQCAGTRGRLTYAMCVVW